MCNMLWTPAHSYHLINQPSSATRTCLRGLHFPNLPTYLFHITKWHLAVWLYSIVMWTCYFWNMILWSAEYGPVKWPENITFWFLTSVIITVMVLSVIQFLLCILLIVLIFFSFCFQTPISVSSPQQGSHQPVPSSRCIMFSNSNYKNLSHLKVSLT